MELRLKEQAACTEREMTVAAVEPDMPVGWEALMQRPIEQWSCDSMLQWAESHMALGLRWSSPKAPGRHQISGGPRRQISLKTPKLPPPKPHYSS